jgi:inhibitor of KinA sporulation pathway (predicted exonuclease)
MNKDNFIILDIEVNVEENAPTDEHFHVIQIGAVKVTNGNFTKSDRFFNSYIHPLDIVQYSSGGEKLTNFIKKLTKIEQAQVDNALIFPLVWKEFLDFCAPYFEFFASWGKYDWDVLKRACAYHKQCFPFRYHVNLKDYYKMFFKDEEVKMGMGVKAASQFFGLPYNEEGAHNGYEDAKMITAIAEKMSEQGFYTFKKAYYEFKDGKITPNETSQYLLNPVIVKKYKEIQKKAKEMEQFLIHNS